MTAETFAAIPLAPGRVVIEAIDSATLSGTLGTPPPASGALHPLFGFIAAQRGISTTIPELCSLADFDIDDGPMMGTIEVEWHAELHPDVEYRVEGEIIDIERKHGRALGDFDLMTYQERVLSADGELLVTTTNTLVLPRRSSS
ncbi:hypothetical protein BH09ACT6_BH09ACT6_05640 [soil metagenome]